MNYFYPRMLCAKFDENSPVILEKILYHHQYICSEVCYYAGILRQLQVIAFCLKNALFLTTHQLIINNSKYNCALDTHLYGQLCIITLQFIRTFLFLLLWVGVRRRPPSTIFYYGASLYQI